MIGTSVGPSERAPRGPASALGQGLVVLCSIVLGVIGALPFVMTLYAVDQLVLAALGLTPRDPTNNDGTATVVIVGVLAPAIVLAIWICLTAVVIGRFRLRKLGAWLLGAAALVLPAVVFVLSRIG